MPDPTELISVARLLLSGARDDISQERLRRAVSTAYYAVFHAVLRAGADRFVGDAHRGTPAYALLYRAFNHGRLRAVCQALDATTLGEPWRRQLGRASVSQEVRDFAQVFRALQEARLAADYSPSAALDHAGVVNLVEDAESALAHFAKIAPDERDDVLALMLVSPRA